MVQQFKKRVISLFPTSVVKGSSQLSKGKAKGKVFDSEIL